VVPKSRSRLSIPACLCDQAHLVFLPVMGFHFCGIPVDLIQERG
jgi:hypothetical protein